MNTKIKLFQKSKKIKTATKNEIHSLVKLCVQNLEKKEFFKPEEKRKIMLENLRNIFYKMDLSKKETRILTSIFAVLTKKNS